MTAATSQRKTPSRKNGLYPVPVAAGVIVNKGLIACVNADGYAVEGSTDTNLIFIGRFEATVNNLAGANGDEQVLVRNDEAFLFENSAADPITQVHFGVMCWIEDNQTVAATDGGGTRSKAGRVVGIDQDGVWVECK